MTLQYMAKVPAKGLHVQKQMLLSPMFIQVCSLGSSPWMVFVFQSLKDHPCSFIFSFITGSFILSQEAPGRFLLCSLLLLILTFSEEQT